MLVVGRVCGWRRRFRRRPTPWPGVWSSAGWTRLRCQMRRRANRRTPPKSLDGGSLVSARLAGAVVVRAWPAVRCPSSGRWPGGRQPRLIAVRWRRRSARTPHTGGPPTSVPQAPRRHRGSLLDPGRPRPSTRPDRGWAVGRRTVCRPQGSGRAEPLRGTRSRQWGSAFGRPRKERGAPLSGVRLACCVLCDRAIQAQSQS
jgi:hypothetical protein